MAVYQCIKFHLIPFNTFRDMLRTSLLQKLRREVTLYILVTGLCFLHSAIPLIVLYHCIKFHLFIISTFRDMLRTSLLLQELGTEITVIYCGRVMVLALFTYSDGCLSMYQISFNSILYFQRYSLDKLFIAEIKKGSNSVNTGGRVIVLAFCNPLSVSQVSLNYLQYF